MHVSPLHPTAPPPCQDAVALAVRLGLEEGEAVLESFPCQLLQRYQAVNGLTPERVIPMTGALHITSRQLLFTDQAGEEAPPALAVELARVEGVRLAEGSRVLLRVRGAAASLHFDSFVGAGAEGALALLEHLTTGSEDP